MAVYLEKDLLHEITSENINNQFYYNIYSKWVKDIVNYFKRTYMALNNIKIFDDPYDPLYESYEKDKFIRTVSKSIVILLISLRYIRWI